MPADTRESAKQELLRQMRAIRKRIDPSVLAKAAAAAESAEAAKSVPPGQVPFDKDNARAGVMMFLQGRQDGGKMAQTIMEAMKQPEAAAKAYARSTPEPEKPKPGLIRRFLG